MKKIYFLLAAGILLVPGVSTAQYVMDGTGESLRVSDSSGRSVVSIDAVRGGTSIAVGGLEILFAAREKKPLSRTHYRGCVGTLEVGLNMLPSPDYGAYPASEQGFLELRNGRSFYFGLNVFNIQTPFNRAQTLGFSARLNLVWRDYVFSNATVPLYENGMIHPFRLDPAPKKSKLNTFSLMLPVLFEFNAHRFFVSAGVYGELVVGSHTKTKFPKEKERGYRYVNTFQAGAAARIGYGRFYLFGNYGLVDLFKSGKGPGVKPVTIGLGYGF